MEKEERDEKKLEIASKILSEIWPVRASKTRGISDGGMEQLSQEALTLAEILIQEWEKQIKRREI